MFKISVNNVVEEMMQGNDYVFNLRKFVEEISFVRKYNTPENDRAAQIICKHFASFVDGMQPKIVGRN